MVLERDKERPEEENDGGVPRLRSFAAPVRDKMIPVGTSFDTQNTFAIPVRDKVIPVDLKPFCDSK